MATRIMDITIEHEMPLDAVSVLLCHSQWNAPEPWVCPEGRYAVCQRLSDGHSPLRLNAPDTGILEAYPQVQSLGFMPASRQITMYPLGQPFRTLTCLFDKAYFEEATELDASDWLNRAGSFIPLPSETLRALMLAIQCELSHPGFGSAAMIEAASTMIAIEMARLGQQSRIDRSISVLATGNQGLAPWQSRRIRERLDAVLEEGIPSIADMAKLCGISRSHLMRMFKASTGTSLQQFILVERLNHARRMLIEDRLSIKEIAAVLGFCNTAHFSNAFRKAQGVAPSDFRMQARAGSPLTH